MKKESRLAQCGWKGIAGLLSLLFAMVSTASLGQTYQYSYMPAMGSYTNTGSGTSTLPAINYNRGSLAGGTTSYTNGQIKSTVSSHTSSTITFKVAKVSGYFKNGNSGKVFVLDNYYGDLYASSFSISNSSTSYVTVKVTGYQDFTGTRTFDIFLITSDQVYKQYGGKISITGSKSQLPPTVQTYEPTGITSYSVTFSGRVNPNGSSTTYYFKYGTSSSMNQKTTSKTLSASAGETEVSVKVTDLSSNSNYSVQLWAENTGGTSKGSVYTFNTLSAPNNPPSTPTNPSPAVASKDQPVSGTLSWDCSDPDGDAITYKVYLGTSTSSMSLYKTVSSRSCSYSLSPATTYYWYVEASDGKQSSTGQTWNFKTKSNLSHPTDPSPADRATNVPVSGTFSWSGNNTGDVTYSVWIGTSSVSQKVYKTTKNTYIDYDGLTAGENYFWKVIVTDGNETESSALWQFKTAESSIPGGDCDFSDVPKTNAYYEPTCYLYKLNVLSGSDVSGKMDVESNLTRAHLAKIAFRGVYSVKGRSVPSSVPSDTYPTVYSDIAIKTVDNNYYYQAARALLYLEYGDGIAPFDRNRLEFAPNENIARVHVLKVLMESFNIKPDMSSTSNPFPNDADMVNLASSNPRLMGYVRKAVSLGIISKGRPYDNCLRGEAFTMLARLIQKVDDGSINDPNPGTADYFEPLNTTLQTISLGLTLPMGNFQHYTKTSFALGGTVPLTFSHTYNSYNTTLPEVFYGGKETNGMTETYQPLGDGWSHNYHSFITVVGSGSSLRAVIHWGGGKIDIYKSNGTELIPESFGVYDKLYANGNEYVVKTKKQMEYHFSKQGGSGAVVLYLSSVVDRNGNTLTIQYESGENGSMRISRVSDGNRQLSFSYRSGTNLVSRISDPIGRSIKFTYTLNSQTGHYQLSEFTDAKGQTTTYIYGDDSKVSTSKLLTRIQLPKGNYIENDYDANRRLTKTVSGMNGVPTTQTSISVNASYGSSTSTNSQVKVNRGSLSTTYNYTYNDNNMMTGMTGEKGLFVNNTYGNNTHPQLPTSLKSNKTNITDVRYDSMGNILSVTIDGDETVTTTNTYDNMNNLTSTTDPMGNKTTFNYDSKGNLISVSAPEGVTSSIKVDSKGLPVEFCDAMGIRTCFEYNVYGNLTKTTLPALNLSSSSTYDMVSRLTCSTDALGRTMKFAYDDNDNLTSTIDPEQHTTRYEYDANDNLTDITNAKGDVTSMSYDNATDWMLSMSFAGATKKFDYNEDGTLKSFTKPDGTLLNYSYDDLGRVVSDGIRNYTYDDNLRLKSISCNGKTLSYTYDGLNRIIRSEFNGHSNTYTYDKNGNCTSVNNTMYEYDGLNRLTSVKFNGMTIFYTYRKDSKLSTITYPNSMTTTYGYDAVGRLIEQKTTLANGTIVAGYNFVLDNAGNIISQTTKEPYDDISLINEEITYNYNTGNRITKAGDIRFSFDKNGNTTMRGNEQYLWDESDHLISVGPTDIKYDPLGLIASYGNIEFTTDPIGIGNVLYDSKSGAEYIYGNGLEARIKNDKVSYYITDVRGSVVAIVDEDGNITHKYQYDDYGKVLQKEETDYNPFQYVGKHGVIYLTDHQYYMRARHYDPTIGRFLSEDPIWSINLYPYADNNPIMGIDPEGNISKKEVLNGIKKYVKKGTNYVLENGKRVLNDGLDVIANSLYNAFGDKAVDVCEFIATGKFVGANDDAPAFYMDLMQEAIQNDDDFKFYAASLGYSLSETWTSETWLETLYTLAAIASAGNSAASGINNYANQYNKATAYLGKTEGIGALDMRTRAGRMIKKLYNAYEVLNDSYKTGVSTISAFKSGDWCDKMKEAFNIKVKW